MRVVPVVAAVCLVSGCGMGTDAALTGQDAKTGINVKNSVFSHVATTELATISRLAQAWSAEHGGTMTGFADDFRTSQPTLAASAAVLTDTQVSIALPNGQCVSETLPVGAPTTTSC